MSKPANTQIPTEIVAQIDAWLAPPCPETLLVHRDALRRVRDEIENLKVMVIDRAAQAAALGYAEALMDAQTAISALKWKPPFNGHDAGIVACIAAIDVLKAKP